VQRALLIAEQGGGRRSPEVDPECDDSVNEHVPIRHNA
jgi:hypothetical protein